MINEHGWLSVRDVFPHIVTSVDYEAVRPNHLIRNIVNPFDINGLSIRLLSIVYPRKRGATLVPSVYCKTRQFGTV